MGAGPARDGHPVVPREAGSRGGAARDPGCRLATPPQLAEGAEDVIQRKIIIWYSLRRCSLINSQDNGKTYRLHVHQSEKHKAYVYHLYDIFKPWCANSPVTSKLHEEEVGDRCQVPVVWCLGMLRHVSVLHMNRCASPCSDVLKARCKQLRYVGHVRRGDSHWTCACKHGRVWVLKPWNVLLVMSPRQPSR